MPPPEKRMNNSIVPMSQRPPTLASRYRHLLFDLRREQKKTGQLVMELAQVEMNRSTDFVPTTERSCHVILAFFQPNA